MRTAPRLARMTVPLWIIEVLTSGCADASDTPAGDSKDTGALALPPGRRSLYVSNSANEQPQGSGANLARFTFDATGPLNPMEPRPHVAARAVWCSLPICASRTWRARRMTRLRCTVWQQMVRSPELV